MLNILVHGAAIEVHAMVGVNVRQHDGLGRRAARVAISMDVQFSVRAILRDAQVVVQGIVPGAADKIAQIKVIVAGRAVVGDGISAYIHGEVRDGVHRGRGGCAVIRAVPAEDVVAEAAGEGVIAAAAEDDVVMAAADNDIIAVAAVDNQAVVGGRAVVAVRGADIHNFHAVHVHNAAIIAGHMRHVRVMDGEALGMPDRHGGAAAVHHVDVG